MLAPASSFAVTVVTQNKVIGNFLGSAIAFVTFYGYVLSRYSESRDLISFALMAFTLVAQFGLAIASNLLPTLKAVLPVEMAGLVAPAITLLYETVAYMLLVRAWQRWGAQREMGNFTIIAALIVQSGEIVRLVGVLSAINSAEGPLYEGMVSVAAGIVFDVFARTKVRYVVQMVILYKIAYEPCAEYSLLLQLKYKFGYTPIMVAVPYLALYAAAGDETARAPYTWLLLLMSMAGQTATNFISLLWQNYLHQSAPGAPSETLRETLKRVQQVSGNLMPQVSVVSTRNPPKLRKVERRPATGTNNGLEKLWRWPPGDMAGAFLLVLAVVFFSLGYGGAVTLPWQEMKLNVEGTVAVINSTLVTNSTLVDGG
jgi:hypothetical protein